MVFNNSLKRTVFRNHLPYYPKEETPTVKTRKISAHYIFPGNSTYLKFGILEVSDDGKILRLTDTHGNLKETAGLEFYNGIIVPGFIAADIGNEISSLPGMENIKVLSREIIELTEYLKINQGPVTSHEENRKVIKLILLLQDVLPDTKLETFLWLFTSLSAVIIGTDHETGTFEPGKRPGVNLISNLDLHKLKVLESTTLTILQPVG